MAIDHAGFLRQALDSGVPLDAALAALRRHGATPIDSIKAVREVQKLPLIEAKRLVSESPAWDDIREAHERLAEILASLETDPPPEAVNGGSLSRAYTPGSDPATNSKR
jgi:hypothetical protein